jgi:hypothetical protein
MKSIVASILATCVAVVALAGSNLATASASTPCNWYSSPTRHFHGVFQFNGPPQPTNRYVAGGMLLFYWSQLETSDGVFNWAAIDSAAQTWTSQCKKVGIRVMTSATTSSTSPYSGSATPKWVYDLGVPKVTELDGSTHPQYWSGIYKAKLNAFVHALAQRYDGQPWLAWMQGGIGISGETKVDAFNSNPNRLALWTAVGYTDPLWLQTIEELAAQYKSAFVHTPIVVAIDSSFIGGTPGYSGNTVVNWLAPSGYWLQDDGLRPTTAYTNPLWQTTTHLEEQYLAASRTGDTLMQDISTALKVGGDWVLIYGSDIADPANQSTLQWAAAQASP